MSYVSWLEAQSSPMAAILAVMLLGGSSLGLGLSVLARLAPTAPLRERNPADHFLVALVLGMNLTALGVLIVGSAWLPRGHLAIVLLLPGLALGILSLRKASVRVTATAGRAWRRGLILVVMLAAGPLLVGLCPPVGWDELAYHVEVPRRWIESGRAEVFLDNPYSAFPSGGELLFTVALALGGNSAPGLFNVLVWFVAAALAYRVLRSVLRRSGALVLAAVFAYLPVSLLVATETYVEMFPVVNMLAMLVVSRRAWRDPLPDRHGRAVMLGMLGGGALAFKLTGVLSGLVVVALAWRGRDMRPCLKTITISALVAAAIAAPFYLRPWIATGNPFHPYYAAWFTEQDAAALETSAHHHALSSEKYGVHGPMSFPASLLLATWQGDRFQGSLGWAWPLVALLATWTAWHRRQVRPMALAALAWALAWHLTSQQIRLLLPAVALTVACAGIGLSLMPARVRRVLLATLVLAAALSLQPARTMHFWSAAQHVLRIGAQPSVADWVYTGTSQGYLLACRAVHERCGPEARVLLLLEPRGLYLSRTHLVGTPLAQSLLLTPPERFADPSELLAELRRSGSTHVLVGLSPRHPDLVAQTLPRLRPILSGITELTRQGRLIEVWRDETYLFLRLVDE